MVLLEWRSREVGFAGRKCTYYYQGDQEAVVIFDDVCATRVLTRSSVPRNGKRLLTAAKNEYLIAKVGVDTAAENEPPKVSPKWDLGGPAICACPPLLPSGLPEVRRYSSERDCPYLEGYPALTFVPDLQPPRSRKLPRFASWNRSSHST